MATLTTTQSNVINELKHFLEVLRNSNAGEKSVLFTTSDFDQECFINGLGLATWDFDETINFALIDEHLAPIAWTKTFNDDYPSDLATCLDDLKGGENDPSFERAYNATQAMWKSYALDISRYLKKFD